MLGWRLWQICQICQYRQLLWAPSLLCALPCWQMWQNCHFRHICQICQYRQLFMGPPHCFVLGPCWRLWQNCHFRHICQIRQYFLFFAIFVVACISGHISTGDTDISSSCLRSTLDIYGCRNKALKCQAKQEYVCIF